MNMNTTMTAPQRRPRLNSLAVLGTVSVLALAAAQVPAHAQTANFAGQRVDLLVPFAPGGGTDVYARALAPFLEKHLPGKPTLLVRNVPGGGSVTGANQFEARAKPDGLHAIVSSASTVTSYVFHKEKVQFHLSKWEPVIVSPLGSVVYAAASTGVKGPQDIAKLRGQQLVFGGGTATAGEARHIVSFELLGLNVKYVWGIARGPVRLAFERGEFNINYDAAQAYLKNAMPLVKAGKAVPLYSMGIIDAKGNVVRDPNLPELPTFVEVYELMHGKKPSGPGYEAWKALTQMGVMANKAILLPAGTPRHIVEAWRGAVRLMLEDPEFEKVAAIVAEGYPQSVGEEARPVIREATSLSPEVWEWLRTYYKKRHNLAL
jgi:tripartite-type tricarboxylate transporter receptor subunit TctC